MLGFFIGGGNFTEEYGILFQFIILYLFYKSEYGKDNFKTGYLLIGVGYRSPLFIETKFNWNIFNDFNLSGCNNNNS